MKVFSKSFTQQESIPGAGIARAIDLLQSGRLHRYNTLEDEISETAELETEYAAYQSTAFCVAVASGGQAMQIAMRSAGVVPGTTVLANAYTLAPVPGAIHAVGGKPILVEIEENWHTDIDDLRAKAKASGAKFLMLSHMRGHIADMDAICAICAEFDITMIEDCAHTMGAKWHGKRSGNFGEIACFSTQTYKHMNSGEGGLLTTNDPEIAAKAVIASGSYMLYSGHGARADDAVFDEIKMSMPNCSARMDNLRAAILRPQLSELDNNIVRWNKLYNVLANGLSAINGIKLPKRAQHEAYVGSSIQFHANGIALATIPHLLENCRKRGVEIKWFGGAEPIGFTSRYDSWKYLGDLPDLPQTKRVLSTTCDMRVPLTFDEEDCRLVVEIIGEEVTKLN